MAPPGRERRQAASSHPAGTPTMRMAPPGRERRPPANCCENAVLPDRETVFRRPRRSAGTAWNAGLRPASRGSAKPAPMTPGHAKCECRTIPQPGMARALCTPPTRSPRLFHDGRGVQADPIMEVSLGGGFTPASLAAGQRNSQCPPEHVSQPAPPSPGYAPHPFQVRMNGTS